jgi:voltage-gated sodium channel
MSNPITFPARCARIAASGRFQGFIIAVILANAALIGLETSADLMARFGPMLLLGNAVIQGIFLIEIAVRLCATWPRPHRFFTDGWNVFDFLVVAVSLLPVAGPFATVSRLARLLRVTRLVSVSPDLRLIVQTMLRSIPSMGHVSILLGLLVYVYGVLGFYLFSPHDPAHWGSLGTSLMSVFQLLTLEGWVEMQRALLPAVPWAWIYFASFVIVGVFIVINLFIAVVLNNLEQTRARERAAQLSGDDLLERVRRMRADIADLETVLEQQRLHAPGR